MERMFGLSHLQIYDLQHSGGGGGGGGGGISSVHDDRSILKLAGQNILGKFIKSPEPLPAVCLNHQNLNNVIAMNLTNEQNGKFAKGNDNKKNGSGVPRKPVNRSQSTKSGKISNKSSNCNNNSDKFGKNNNNNSNNNNNNNNDTKKSNVEETSPQGKTTNTLVDTTKSNNNGSSAGVEINANTTIANPSAGSLKRKSLPIGVSAVVGGPPKTEFDMQKQKYIKVISILNQHNRHLELELTLEKRRRAEELSRIIKSLLCFEAKLKHDKKVINRRLYEKDTEISKLLTLNKMLRKKYVAAAVVAGATADSAADDLEADLMNAPGGEFGALNCPNCRKDFYELTGKDVWTQTFTDERSSNEDHTENGSSSDETVSSSFYGARRSVRYTSKRNFRDYMRSRCMAIDHPSLNNSEENMSTLSRDDSNNSTYEKTNAFSRKIERLHGVRRIESFTDDIDSEIESNRRNCNKSINVGDYESDEMFMPIKSRPYRIKKFAETSPKQEFEASTDDWYASASDVDDSENLRAKPYGYNAVNPVLECVNQILLQQSMDECAMDGPPSLESSENTSGSGGSSQRGDGTVSRKRVHFSIKNSMVHVPRDDRIPPPSRNVVVIDSSSEQQKDCNLNYESIYSNEYERIGSEHNSSNLYVDMESKLGQEDRIADKAKKPPALPPKPANLIKFKRVLKITPHPVSIKEDEPKTDGEQKNSADELDAIDDDGEEPDYCSISEVNEAITSVQIVADVHKSADDDISSNSSEPALSQKTDEVEEIFADIPKLPNVAAIIVPKPINKFITTDNYILKEATTPTSTTTMSMGQSIKSPQIPNILAEINKKANSSNNSQPALSTPPTTPSKSSMNLPSLGSPSKILSVPPEDKLPLQAEFDWYNLDVEYGKSNQPDVIKETDVTTLEYHQMVTVNESDELEDDPDDIGIGGNYGGVLEDDRILMSPEHSVEYKLDEEFCLINQPDIIKENVFDAKTVCNGFATVTDESPGHQQTDKAKINRKNFKNFMDTTGLSTKPLPRQRKIYFSGPFV